MVKGCKLSLGSMFDVGGDCNDELSLADSSSFLDDSVFSEGGTSSFGKGSRLSLPSIFDIGGECNVESSFDVSSSFDDEYY